MNRSGNIGAAKNMDTVFADFTDEDLEQDFLFDEDDQLVEIVEGYTEEGNTIFEEDEEIFKIAHQIADDNNTPAEEKKEAEDLLGPDNKTDEKISDIEDVKKEELDDSQTMDELKKNGESEADKELDHDELEKEYQSPKSVEEAYEKWLHENPYEYDKENEAEGTDDELGKDIDNSLPTDDVKPEEDENYNATADASVKEEYNYDKENEAEGTDDKFGNKEVDNSLPKPEEVAPEGDEEYNATNDASVKEGCEGEECKEEEKCDCGKPECPICSKKVVVVAVAPEEEKKVEDAPENHEESEGETVTPQDGDGSAPANVDDNTLPKPEDMTPEGSPEADNGDISDDSDDQKKLDEAFDKWLHEEDSLELPLDGGNTPMLPEDVQKDEEELATAAPEADATVPAEEGCGAKKEHVEIEIEVKDDHKEEEAAPEAPADECGDAVVGMPVSPVPEENLEEAFDKWLHEEDEVEAEVPTEADVEDAAKTEVEDTESELDDDLAAVADDDSDEDEVDLEYDPSDEDLIDLAGGEDIEEAAVFH